MNILDETYFADDNLRCMYDTNKALFNELHDTVVDHKEQAFFAYIVTHISKLIDKYGDIVLLFDVDETLCTRVAPEDYFQKEYIFSARGYDDNACDISYHSADPKNPYYTNGYYQKANAHQDISTKHPDKRFVLIDDLVKHREHFVPKMDWCIPFPRELIMTEEDGIKSIL